MDGHDYTAHFEAPDGKPVLKAYPDPITKGTPWTIGLGHTGNDVHKGDEWPEAKCWSTFYNDYALAYAEASQVVGTSCWAKLSDERMSVLADMAFQMGGTGLSKFVKMLAAVRKGDWEQAKVHMLDSDYARQLKELQSDKTKKTRAEINADTLVTSKWPGDHKQGESVA